jgi:hypothetical protein
MLDSVYIIMLKPNGEKTMTNITNIKNKIKALLAKTTDNGASESEALVAMKMVGKLLNEYNLSMDEVTVRDEICVKQFVETNNKHTNEQVMVSPYVAKLCSVKVWMSRTNTGIHIYFFGLEPDVQLAIYLIEMVGNVYQSEFSKFKNSDFYKNYIGHRKTLAINFQHGYATRINTRISQMIEDAKASNISSGSSTALVVIEKSKFVNEEFAKSGPKLVTKKSASSAKYNSGAHSAGSNAGNKPSLSRPLA